MKDVFNNCKDVSINSDKRNEHYQFVYIEDSPVFRRYWSKAAKEKGITLLLLESTGEFDSYKDNISEEETMIYLDCDLGENEMRGDEFATILHKRGYKHLYMCTNYDAEEFSHLPWLKYAGKNCPFSDLDLDGW